MAESAKRALFAAGEIVTRQGAQAHYLYVLVSGQVDVLVSTEGGGPSDEEGTVEFVARFRQGPAGPEQTHHERARFVRGPRDRKSVV